MNPIELLLIAVVLGLVLVSLLGWSIAAWRPQRRLRELTTSERWIGRAAVVYAGLILAGMVAAVIGLLGPVPFGLPPAAFAGIGLLTVTATVGLGLIPAAVIAWRQKALSVAERLNVTAPALVAPVFLWWLNYWNLFGSYS